MIERVQVVQKVQTVQIVERSPWFDTLTMSGLSLLNSSKFQTV